MAAVVVTVRPTSPEIHRIGNFFGALRRRQRAIGQREPAVGTRDQSSAHGPLLRQSEAEVEPVGRGEDEKKARREQKQARRRETDATGPRKSILIGRDFERSVQPVSMDLRIVRGEKRR